MIAWRIHLLGFELSAAQPEVQVAPFVVAAAAAAKRIADLFLHGRSAVCMACMGCSTAVHGWSHESCFVRPMDLAPAPLLAFYSPG